MGRTVLLDEALADEAMRLAAREATTLEAIVARALRRELARDDCGPARFSWEDMSVGGDGLSDYARGKTMTELIHESYERT